MSANPPAFPQQCADASDVGMVHEGMSLRDWFAGQAILGIAGYFTNLDADEIAEDAAKSATIAYEIADALLAARVQS